MVLGSIAERLKQSAMVGFMLAGLLLGPNVLGVVQKEMITAIADLGVTLLMFTIGLEFSWSRLRRLGRTAVVSGTGQIVGTIAGVTAVCMLLELDLKPALAVGAVVALSSTGVVMPALARRSEVDSVHGRFALGILLMQDAAVIPLVLIVAALGGEGAPSEVALSTLLSFGIVLGLVVGFALFNHFFVPRLVAFNAPTGNRDVTVLFAIVVAMGAAWVAWRLGLSPALGAFIAAIFLGESVVAPRLRGDVAPLKTVFVTLFFSSIGMLADPQWIAQNAVMVLGGTLMVILGKPIVVYVVGWLMGLSVRHAVAAGVCMGQVGVFSFVLARVAQDNGVIDGDLFSLLVSITILTLFATPYLVGLGPWAGMRTEGWLRKKGWLKRRDADAQVGAKVLSGHVIVVGFGPAGRAVADRVYKAGTPVAVIDLNPRSVIAARAMGLRAWVGDASSPEVLKTVQVDKAEALVLTLPDHRLSIAVIVEAKELAPKLRIVVRSRYHRYLNLLEAAGATVVVDEEASVGDRLGDIVRLEGRTDPDAPMDVMKEEPVKPAAKH